MARTNPLITLAYDRNALENSILKNKDETIKMPRETWINDGRSIRVEFMLFLEREEEKRRNGK